MAGCDAGGPVDVFEEDQVNFVRLKGRASSEETGDTLVST
jgi:hypothetical protein